jgi:hypothetical protein
LRRGSQAAPLGEYADGLLGAFLSRFVDGAVSQ